MTPTQRVVADLRRNGHTVYTRGQWGSVAGPVYAFRRKFKKALVPCSTVVQHITVTHPKPIKEAAREIERIGLQRFGSGVSYNFLVHMTTGEIAIGQPLDAKGTHTINDKKVSGYSFDQNTHARAIAVLGMPETPLCDKAAAAIAAILAALVREGVVTKEFDYDPHSKFAFKDCPCNSTRDRMASIKTNARKLLGQPK
jgi:hypothetical protein